MKKEISRITMECMEQGKRSVITYKDQKFFKNMLDKSIFPKCTPDKTNITAYYNKGKNEHEIKFTLQDWIKLSNEGQSAFIGSELERLSEDFFTADIPLPEAIKEEAGFESLLDVPRLVMEDVTEVEFFNFHPISEGLLDDAEAGIWSWHGLRKFKFMLSDLPFNLHAKDFVSVKSDIKINKKDNEKLEDAISAVNMTILDPQESDEDNSFCIFAYIDTNLFGEEFVGDTKQFYRFSGALEITCRSIDEDFPSTVTTIYTFPFAIVVHNTEYYANEKIPCPRWDKNLVSIDFGTSSTCVAVQKGNDIELLTLSTEKLLGEINDELSERLGGDINVYENPTNLMLYDWAAIYEQWKKENANFPHFKQGDFDEYELNSSGIGYDAGYTVAAALGSGQSNVLNAIITQIKMVAQVLEQGIQLQISPVVKGAITNVKLVSSPELQDEESLDPIAFYAYLLGRAINNPASSKIYTKFAITYPVKFNKNVRAKLKASLEYGLKRSLPLPLREAKDKKGKDLFQVIMDYSEPVAFVGSVCGRELKASLNNPGLFAVYDFGGGTLDFAFGMFSVDEDDEGTIDIFGIDGDSDLGGESLISRLSYWIYAENKDVMAQNNIPFLKPEDEQIPDDFPTKLFHPTAMARINMRRFDELFSRPLFRNRDGRLDADVSSLTAEATTLELVNDLNEPVQVDINVDYGILVDELRNIINGSIEKFKITMESNFRNNEELIEAVGGSYDMDDIVIFRAGNSSRSVIVHNNMEELFPENVRKGNVRLIDEWADGKENKKYAINPKTAVAIGQLYMRNYTLSENNDSPFAWNIYTESVGDATFVPVLEKNCKNRNWVRFGLMRRNEAEIYCSDTIAENRDDPHFPLAIEGDEESEDWKKAYLYLRIHDESSVEYYISETKKDPDPNLPVNEQQILIIQEPTLT